MTLTSQDINNIQYTIKNDKIYYFMYPNSVREIVCKIASSQDVSIDEYEKLINILNEDTDFRILRNSKITCINMPSIEENLVRCRMCGLEYDGCAQCNCWMQCEDYESFMCGVYFSSK